MNKKELKRQDKQTLRPMGVYQIRNLINEKVFIGLAFNLDGVFCKNKFQLDGNSSEQIAANRLGRIWHRQLRV